MSQWSNTFNTDTFEAFVRKFFDKTEINKCPKVQFFNRKVLINMGDKTTEIVLSTNGQSGKYEGFKVKVIHKINGTISQEWFGFKEYLADGFRTGGAGGSKYPYIIDHCGIDWYMNGAEPKAIKAMASKMADYIEVYV